MQGVCWTVCCRWGRPLHAPSGGLWKGVSHWWKKTTRTLQRCSQSLAAVSPCFNLCFLPPRGGMVFTFLHFTLSPYPLDLLSLQTSFSHTAMFPDDPETPLHFPRIPPEWWHVVWSRWEQHICCPRDARGLPGVSWTYCLVGPSQTRLRLIQFDDAR